MNLNEAAAVGVIGGADGPTAIFITSHLSPGLLLCGALALLAVGGLLAFWFYRR